MIPRTDYLDTLRKWKGKDVIKVITGIRRCGKSTLMGQWKNELLNAGVNEGHIIHINLEALENEALLEYHALHNAVLSQCTDDNMHYVLLDEVQNVKDFQKAIDSLYVRNNIDLYITGSNAYLLSGTLATLLSGRYVEIAMLPFSFSEYAKAHEESAMSAQRLWSNYLHDGSFPALMQFAPDDVMTFDYLEGLLNTVLVKDVSQRAGGNASLLYRLSRFLYDNIGNLSSSTSIAKAISAADVSISAPTVSRYLAALKAAYLIYPVERYDVRGKKLMKQEMKFYAVDMGLRRILCSNKVRDTGRILENIVFLELLRREKNVYVGKMPSGEVDFVTSGSGGVKYWQVSESVANEETLQRELKPLKQIRDNHPKTLLTLDDEHEHSFDGIRQIYVLDWLLGKTSIL